MQPGAITRHCPKQQNLLKLPKRTPGEGSYLPCTGVVPSPPSAAEKNEAGPRPRPTRERVVLVYSDLPRLRQGAVREVSLSIPAGWMHAHAHQTCTHAHMCITRAHTHTKHARPCPCAHTHTHHTYTHTKHARLCTCAHVHQCAKCALTCTCTRTHVCTCMCPSHSHIHVCAQTCTCTHTKLTLVHTHAPTSHT